ncbi:hypothetical protein [Saccharothrix xinjiangensis]|uniref:Tyr recombinase domain-containing protein n=1 Tax=Saccharothrix xinjiangensis TaxID=204798 RepID=A0ABV9XZ64_9PSEU
MSVKRVGKRWLADGRVTDRDGHLVRVRRTGDTKTAAEEAWQEGAQEAAEQSRDALLSKDSRVNKLIDLWLEYVEQETALGEMSKNSLRQYKSYVKNWIRPALGHLTIREFKLRRMDSLIQKAHEKDPSVGASIRAVLSLLCGFAVQNEIMDVNPIRSAKRRRRSSGKEVVSMTRQQRRDLREKLVEFAQAQQVDKTGRSKGARGRVWLDLPELMDAMLATGVRIGELAALQGTAFDPATHTVRVAAHIIREEGVGLVREEYRKGGNDANRKALTLVVPEWSVPMWRRRRMAAGEGPMFAGFRGGWQDPVTLIHRLREAFTGCGYDWVTSHVWRKTVAAVLDEAGLGVGVVADQLGNTRSVAERHYIPPRSTNGIAAAALEEVY